MAHGGPTMTEPRSSQSASFSADTHTAVVRYQVRDLERAVAFYTRHLGFGTMQRSGPVAIIARGDLRLPLERSGKLGLATDAGWSSAGAWRMEQNRPLCGEDRLHDR